MTNLLRAAVAKNARSALRSRPEPAGLRRRRRAAAPGGDEPDHQRVGCDRDDGRRASASRTGRDGRRPATTWRDACVGQDLPEGEYVFLEVATRLRHGRGDASRGSSTRSSRRSSPDAASASRPSSASCAAIGGAIKITSASGRGTTFRVLLPAALSMPQVVAAPVAAPTMRARRARAGGGRRAGPSGRSRGSRWCWPDAR